MEVLNYTNRGDEPFIATSGSSVYIVSQSKTVNGTIHFIRCTDYGMSCTPSQPPGVEISNNLTNSWEPQIVASGNNIYIVYHSVTSPVSNWVTVSSNDGKTFSTPIEISSSIPITGWATQIVTSNCGSGYSCSGGNGSNYVFTQWPVYDSAQNTWYMYASMSSDYGANWTAAPGAEISNNPGFSSIGPNDIATSSIAAFANHAFIAWTMCQQCGQNHNVTLNDSQVIFAVSNPSLSTTTTSSTTSSSTTSSSSSLSTSSSSHISTIVTTTSSSSLTGSSSLTSSATVSTTSIASMSSSSVSLPPPTTTTAIMPTGSQVPPWFYAAALVAVAIVAASIVYVFGFRKPYVKKTASTK
jgi:trimeric autotransporter adhesin